MNKDNNKFGEINMTRLGDGLQPLLASHFSSKIVTAFTSDGDRANQQDRLATFDSIHDFKTFGTNPIDMIEYQRKLDAYNMNRLFFNFNRIMNRGQSIISTENSFLYKPKGLSSSGYDNKPTPIASTSNVEDYFCLLNLYKLARDTEPTSLYVIKGAPKSRTGPDIIDNENNYKAITAKIIEKGWFDSSGNKKFINTITDVSPVFRKYYIFPHKKVDENISYRCLVTQENANDPAGSLGKELLSNAFGTDNVCIEDPNQARTYKPEEINSYFEPTLNGIENLKIGVDINFDVNLTIKDTSTFEPILEVERKVIPYAKANNIKNPNERTVINAYLTSMFKNVKKESCSATDLLVGRDDNDHSQANAIYNNSIVDDFSKGKTQKNIALSFTRKRLGDVLLASICRLINSKYDNDKSKRIHFTTLTYANVIPESAIFIGEDRMIIAFCLINKIPCIYDNKNYTILYLPTKNQEFYSKYATLYSSIPSALISIPTTSMIGGTVTRSQHNRETMWDEPYYFFKFLHLHFTGSNFISILQEIDTTLVNCEAVGNVLQLHGGISRKRPETYAGLDDMLMYYVCKIKYDGSTNEENFAAYVTEAQNLVNNEYGNGEGNPYSFINVVDKLTVTQTEQKQSFAPYKSVLIASTNKIEKIYKIDFDKLHIMDNVLQVVEDSLLENGETNPEQEGGEKMQVDDERKSMFDGTFYIQKTDPTADLYNSNIEALNRFFNILKLYEINSILDEATENFYDINDSGVCVAFDCFFYVFFDHLVNEFKEHYNKVRFDLLVYYLNIYQKDLYLSFDEIMGSVNYKSFVLDKKLLETVILNSSKDPVILYTTQYFDKLIKRSLVDSDNINKEMYNLFITGEFAEQYRCAVKNKFTHYGFTTIYKTFETVIKDPFSSSLSVGNENMYQKENINNDEAHLVPLIASGGGNSSITTSTSQVHESDDTGSDTSSGTSSGTSSCTSTDSSSDDSSSDDSSSDESSIYYSDSDSDDSDSDSDIFESGSLQIDRTNSLNDIENNIVRTQSSENLFLLNSSSNSHHSTSSQSSELPFPIQNSRQPTENPYLIQPVNSFSIQSGNQPSENPFLIETSSHRKKKTKRHESGRKSHQPSENPFLIETSSHRKKKTKRHESGRKSHDKKRSRTKRKNKTVAIEISNNNGDNPIQISVRV